MDLGLKKRFVTVVGKEADFRGLNYEAHPKLVLATTTHLVVKVHGRRCWSGRGEYRYTSPCIIVMQIDASPSDNHYEAHVLLEEDLTRNTSREVWKKAEKLVPELREYRREKEEKREAG
jgi:hypothetical protein